MPVIKTSIKAFTRPKAFGLLPIHQNANNEVNFTPFQI
jgi:hypothetical protein